MAELIITLENPDDEALLLSLAKRLNAKVTLKATLPPRPDADAMIRALDKITASGTFDYITDPVAWQRSVRQDRPLPFAE